MKIIIDKRGNTPLHLAVLNNKKLKFLKNLLRDGVNIRTRNHNGSTPLDIAIENNKTSAALLLIKRGALKGEDLDYLFFTAIKKRNRRVVSVLIDHVHILPINLINYLKKAVSIADLKFIEKFLPYSGFSNFDDTCIPEKLLMKSSKNSNNCIKKLLQWKFTIHPQCLNNMDILCSSIKNGYLPILEEFLNHGININSTKYNPTTGYNLLMGACLNQHHEIAEALLQNGANPNLTDFEGRSALHIACNSNFTNFCLLKLLLEYGGQINLVDNRGWTPLFYACDQNNYQAVKYLVENSANLNCYDQEYQFPIHIAVKMACDKKIQNDDQAVRLIKFLVQHGAKIDVRDSNSHTPLWYVVTTILSMPLNLEIENLFISRRGSEIIKIIISRIIKLRTAELPFVNYDLTAGNLPDGVIFLDELQYSARKILQLDVTDEPNPINFFRELQNRCRREVQRMKEIKAYNNISFYTFINGTKHQYNKFFRKNKEEQKLIIDSFNIRFQLYTAILKNRLKAEKINYEKSLFRTTVINYSNKNIFQRLPVEIIQKIFLYLNDNELETFYRAFQS